MRISDSRGFTLLELLVVVALVGILTGTVVLSIRGADAEQRLRGATGQLAYQLELARQYALQRNREWGLFVDEDGIRFAEFDEIQDAWVMQTQPPFGGLELDTGVRVQVESEDFAGLSEEDRERLPQIILFSSGEVTPFRLIFDPPGDARSWIVSSDGLSRVQAEAEET